MYFYFLGVSGSLLYFYMVAVGVLVQFLTPEDKLIRRFGSESVARASWGVFDALSGWVAVSFVMLAAFHTYLLCIGLGTFDWVVLQVRFEGTKRRGLALALTLGSGGYSVIPLFCTTRNMQMTSVIVRVRLVLLARNAGRHGSLENSNECGHVSAKHMP